MQKGVKPVSLKPDMEASLEKAMKRKGFKGWDSTAAAVVSFKKLVMEVGLSNQSHRCIWCTLLVGERGRRTAHRDHIAPKSLYPQWTFLPDNIAISCEYCNGFMVKGDLDTVRLADASYRNSDFLIVHPYIDDIDRHIGFIEDAANIPAVICALSERGKWTISKLNLDSVFMTMQRAREILIDREYSKISQEDQDRVRSALSC